MFEFAYLAKTLWRLLRVGKYGINYYHHVSTMGWTTVLKQQPLFPVRTLTRYRVSTA